uniref:Uncharacterized protein n=1 Tax=viral metagenome TaxID=1070528 RepID=A0A6C0C582_9ZZZZ
MNNLSCKVVMLGDTSVGKSCLTSRFLRDVYFEFEESTIGAAFSSKIINYKGKEVKLEIWDTAGQERYRALAPMYYRNAKAAVVVYDITQYNSFIGAKSWIEELQDKREDCLIILVGNKFDLNDRRTVDIDTVKDYASDKNLIHLESSAKTGNNVEDIFITICKEIKDYTLVENHNATVCHDIKNTYYYGCC